MVRQLISDEPISEGTKQKVTDIRHVLLRLHKSLLDFERVGYERVHGRIENSYEFLNLVMHNPWFAWLRHLSGSIHRKTHEPVVFVAVLLDHRLPMLPSLRDDPHFPHDRRRREE